MHIFTMSTCLNLQSRPMADIFYFLHFYSTTSGLFWLINQKTAKQMDLGKSWVGQVLKISCHSHQIGHATAFPNFCRYIRKCSFLAVISKPAGSMNSRAILKVILHWFRSNVISETIKRGDGSKPWFHWWVPEPRMVT